MRDFDVIVIGGGHAGIEAALASARMGRRTLMVTLNVDTIGRMSCNPAIGGVAKGQLVREIDALGGEMARATDEAGTQFRMLNMSKGPAVWSPRAQADRRAYAACMTRTVTSTENLSVRQDEVVAIRTKGNVVTGVDLLSGDRYDAQAVVVTTGTFLRGLIYIGMTHYPGGRTGDPAATHLSDSLTRLGIELRRFKTGTTPRLDCRTIDVSNLIRQDGDEPPRPFSHSTESIQRRQLPCYITHTNERTHALIGANLDRSPLMSGVIKGIGPRYCPSIEDKVVKFPARTSHHIFLEPEGYDSVEIYPNGISTSLPIDVQIALVRTIEGCEAAEIIRPGYAIEYDCIDPTILDHSLMVRALPGLFTAGQINGTSGYEEAAAQGLVAGINAARRCEGREPFALKRSEAYIGVLIDDLVTKGTNEPYRLFTSRAEFRLLLREDNADLRLARIGHEAGLLPLADFERVERKRRQIGAIVSHLTSTRVGLRSNHFGDDSAVGLSLAEYLKRPEIRLDEIAARYSEFEPFEAAALATAEIEVKYEGYIAQELDAIGKLGRYEQIAIDVDLDFSRVAGLSREVVEKLEKARPVDILAASRIPGVTPAAIMALVAHVRMGRTGR